MKGHARKLSGKTCKGSEIQIIPKTNRTWRERKSKSKNGKGCPVAGCVASACK